jgi:hypothetical protein
MQQSKKTRPGTGVPARHNPEAAAQGGDCIDNYEKLFITLR